MGLIDRVKGLFESSDESPRVVGGVSETESLATSDVSGDERRLEVDFTDPGPEAATCRLNFDRPVAPGGTALFETPQDAADWPVVRALLGLTGVHSVISKNTVLIVAKHERSSWPEILGGVDAAISRAFDADFSETKQVSASADSGGETDLRSRVSRILEEEVNPAVAEHGGYIELLDVKDTRVFIHMGGGCQGCAMSAATLKHGVETTLRAQIPEITEILDTTDHAAGANPFFRAEVG